MKDPCNIELHTPTQHIKLGQIFSKADIAKAAKIYADDRVGRQDGDETLHSKLKIEIVEPLMEHINEVTGQENDANYFAYLLEHVLITFVMVQ